MQCATSRRRKYNRINVFFSPPLVLDFRYRGISSSFEEEETRGARRESTDWKLIDRLNEGLPLWKVALCTGSAQVDNYAPGRLDDWPDSGPRRVSRYANFFARCIGITSHVKRSNKRLKM